MSVCDLPWLQVSGLVRNDRLTLPSTPYPPGQTTELTHLLWRPARSFYPFSACTRFLCRVCMCARAWLTFVSQRPARCGEKIPVMPLFCLTVNSAAAINLFMHIAVSSTVRWNLAPLTAFTESSLFAQDAH